MSKIQEAIDLIREGLGDWSGVQPEHSPDWCNPFQAALQVLEELRPDEKHLPDGPYPQFYSLYNITDQLEFCGYKDCVGQSLEMNGAYKQLKHYSNLEEDGLYGHAHQIRKQP